jgi:hypothetical protein
MIAHVRPSAQVTGWRVCARSARSSLGFGVQAEGVQCDGRAAAIARPYVRGTEPHNALGLQGTYILRHFVQWHCSGCLPSSGMGAWRGLFTLVYHVSARRPSVRLSRSSTSNGNRDASFSGT